MGKLHVCYFNCPLTRDFYPKPLYPDPVNINRFFVNAAVCAYHLFARLVRGIAGDEEFIDSGQEDYNYPDAMPTGLGMEEPIEETQENADAESGAKEAVLQAE